MMDKWHSGWSGEWDILAIDHITGVLYREGGCNLSSSRAAMKSLTHPRMMSLCPSHTRPVNK